MPDAAMADEALLQRIREAIERSGAARKELAAKAGISRQYLYDIRKGASGLSLDVAVRLARALGLTTEPVQDLRVREATADYDRPFDVPLLRLDVAAGEPRLEVIPGGPRPYYFRREWMTRRGWNGDRNDDRFGIYHLGARDIADSMFPTIQPGSVLLVDRRPDRSRITPRSIWIVRVPSGGEDDPQAPLFGDQPETRLTTKRVTMIDHQFVLESDNHDPRHAPRLVKCRPSERETILEGRVIWFATEVA